MDLRVNQTALKEINLIRVASLDRVFIEQRIKTITFSLKSIFLSLHCTSRKVKVPLVMTVSFQTSNLIPTCCIKLLGRNIQVHWILLWQVALCAACVVKIDLTVFSRICLFIYLLEIIRMCSIKIFNSQIAFPRYQYLCKHTTLQLKNVPVLCVYENQTNALFALN